MKDIFVCPGEKWLAGPSNSIKMSMHVWAISSRAYNGTSKQYLYFCPRSHSGFKLPNLISAVPSGVITEAVRLERKYLSANVPVAF